MAPSFCSPCLSSVQGRDPRAEGFLARVSRASRTRPPSWAPQANKGCKHPLASHIAALHAGVKCLLQFSLCWGRQVGRAEYDSCHILLVTSCMPEEGRWKAGVYCRARLQDEGVIALGTERVRNPLVVHGAYQRVKLRAADRY